MKFEGCGSMLARFCEPANSGVEQADQRPQVRHQFACGGIQFNSIIPRALREWFAARETKPADNNPPVVAGDGANLVTFKLLALSEIGAPLATEPIFVDWSKKYYQDKATALSAAWARPVMYRALASQLQEEKKQLFVDAVNRPTAPQRRADLQAAIRSADCIHGKAGHTENVVSVTSRMLRDMAISSLCDSDTSAAEIKEASQWLGLADLDVPVSLLMAKRKLEVPEMKLYILPRFANSALQVRKLKLATEPVPRLIEQARNVVGDRPMASQILDMADRLSALAAKPYFQLTSSKMDVAKVFGTIEKNLKDEQCFVAPALMATLRDFADRGEIDKALLHGRDENIYIKP